MGGFVVVLDEVECAEVGETQSLQDREPAPARLVNEPLEEFPRLVDALEARKDAGEVAHRLNARRVVEHLLFLGGLSAEAKGLLGLAPMKRRERQLGESEVVGLRAGLGERERLPSGGL